ncbi:MAG: PfkB family carbohydrate kinase [Ktedonobacterales bacterium]
MMVRPPQRLVLVGSVLVDILLYIDQLPERGGDILAEQSIIASGGGMNVLVAARRLGLPVAYAGRVGDGAMGRQVLADLESRNIPLLLPRVHGEDSGFDVGLVEPNAERSFITSPGTESRLLPTDLEAIPLSADDAVYVSGYELCYPISGASLESWLPALDSLIWLVLDPGPLAAEIPAGRLARVLARTTIFTSNAREAYRLTGRESMPEAAAELGRSIAAGGWAIVRVGEQGCWVAGAEGTPLHVPGRKTRAVDTTGAGDAHTAALLARLAAGDAVPAAARMANIAASLSVERRGPATGPTAAELSEALHE